MAVSMEALAMAGTDYLEWGLDVDEWENQDSDMDVPLHLLADDFEEEQEDEKDGVINGVWDDQDHDRDRGFEGFGNVVAKPASFYVKVLAERVMKSLRYLKAVTTITINLKLSEIPERFGSMRRIFVPLKQLLY